MQKIVFLFAAMLVLASCSQKTTSHATIEGVAPWAAGGTAQLVTEESDSLVFSRLDTNAVQIGTDGTFKIELDFSTEGLPSKHVLATLRLIDVDKERGQGAPALLYDGVWNVEFTDENNQPRFAATGEGAIAAEYFNALMHDQYPNEEGLPEDSIPAMRREYVMDMYQKHRDSWFMIATIGMLARDFIPQDTVFLRRVANQAKVIGDRYTHRLLAKQLQPKLNLVEGATIPDIEVVDSSGAKVRLSTTGLKKYNVIDFWASWCGPCIRSMPTLEELAASTADSVGFYGISVDQNPAQWMKALRKHDPVGQQFHDAMDNTTPFDIEYIPYYLVVDDQLRLLTTPTNTAEHVVMYFHWSREDYEEMRNEEYAF